MSSRNKRKSDGNAWQLQKLNRLLERAEKVYATDPRIADIATFVEQEEGRPIVLLCGDIASLSPRLLHVMQEHELALLPPAPEPVPEPIQEPIQEPVPVPEPAAQPVVETTTPVSTAAPTKPSTLTEEQRRYFALLLLNQFTHSFVVSLYHKVDRGKQATGKG